MPSEWWRAGNFAPTSSSTSRRRWRREEDDRAVWRRGTRDGPPRLLVGSFDGARLAVLTPFVDDLLAREHECSHVGIAGIGREHDQGFAVTRRASARGVGAQREPELSKCRPVRWRRWRQRVGAGGTGCRGHRGPTPARTGSSSSRRCTEGPPRERRRRRRHRPVGTFPAALELRLPLGHQLSHRGCFDPCCSTACTDPLS